MGYAPQAREQLLRFLVNCAAMIAAVFLVASVCSAQAPAGQTPDEQLSEFLNKHPGLLPEFGQLRLQHNVQFPAPRPTSRVLPLLPESTMAYVAYPNYGEAACI
jgi:hypothetical protein